MFLFKTLRASAVSVSVDASAFDDTTVRFEKFQYSSDGPDYLGKVLLGDGSGGPVATVALATTDGITTGATVALAQGTTDVALKQGTTTVALATTDGITTGATVALAQGRIEDTV